MQGHPPCLRGKAPSVQTTAIGHDVLERIYASDQDMYPAPLTSERLRSWVEACPELSICFQARPGEDAGLILIGAIIVLPLVKRYWEDVMEGKLKEIDIDPATMFADGSGAEVGLHIFHIERFDTATRTLLPYLAEYAVETLSDMAQIKGWDILGYSALTATAAGREAFGRMGFELTGYEEVFVTNYEAIGAMTVNMVCIYPGGDIPETRGTVHSKSVMVARFQDKFAMARMIKDQFH